MVFRAVLESPQIGNPERLPFNNSRLRQLPRANGTGRKPTSNRQTDNAGRLKIPLAGFDFDRYTPGKLGAAAEPAASQAVNAKETGKELSHSVDERNKRQAQNRAQTRL
jgi:hypothetical protein